MKIFNRKYMYKATSTRVVKYYSTALH